MKRILKLLLMIFVATLPLKSFAQENLKRAIDDFIKSPKSASYVKDNVSGTWKDSSDRVVSYLYSYKFAIPKSKKRILDNMLNSFEKDRHLAYNIFIKDKDDNGYDNEIVYGSRLEFRATIGLPLYNTKAMFVSDPLNPMWRYAYVLMWTDDDSQNNICGFIYKIYGPDPKKESTDDWHKDHLSSSSVGKSTMNSRDSDDVSSLFSSIKTPDLFLRRFGTLYQQYKESTKQHDDTLLSGLVGSFVTLCKNSKVLEGCDGERKVCVDCLQELRKSETDIYRLGMLNVAIKYISK